MRLDDPALDAIASQTREALLLEALRRQIAFMRTKVPYWRERLATARVDEGRIESMHDLACLPNFSKEELRSIRPAALLSDQRDVAMGMSISNLYGSSEFGPFSISCTENPGDYHVAQGHVLVEVVDRSGVPVANGQSGRIVVTQLCGMEENGHAPVHDGTQILRLAGGDGATWLTDPCDCGLTTPRVRDVHRLAITDWRCHGELR